MEHITLVLATVCFFISVLVTCGMAQDIARGKSDMVGASIVAACWTATALAAGWLN